MYCSLVRSIAEYAIVLWDSFTGRWFLAFKAFSNAFLIIGSLYFENSLPSALQIMHNLWLIFLVDRRVEANLVFLRKLLNGCVDVSTSLSQTNFKAPSHSTRFYMSLFIIYITNIMVGSVQLTVWCVWAKNTSLNLVYNCYKVKMIHYYISH